MGDYKRGRPKKYNPFTGKGSVPPEAPGEYRIRKDDGSYYYVGETNNLRRRLKEHKKKGRLSELESGFVEFIEASSTSSSSSRREHEQRSIKKHKPSNNKSRGGEGRPARNSYDLGLSNSTKNDSYGASALGILLAPLAGLLGVAFSGCLTKVLIAMFILGLLLVVGIIVFVLTI